MLLQDFPYLADNPSIILAIGGFFIGLIFGATVILTNFCTMGAIADAVTHGDYRRFRSWVLAAAIALAGTQALLAAGLLDLRESVYLQGRMNWMGALAGGLVFGFGMVLAGGCPSRNIARAGSGDLRALVILLVMAVFTYIAWTGLLAPVRVVIERITAVTMPAGAEQSLDGLVGIMLETDALALVRPLLAALIAVAAMVYCFADRGFRSSVPHMLAGAVVGLGAVVGWIVTSMGRDPFAIMHPPPSSLTFVRPVAESVVYFTRFTGVPNMGFGVGMVLGSVVGAAIAALATGRFRLTGFSDQADTGRNLAGAALMGIGGVLALGCSIGQGVTGISTMALTSFLAFAAMSGGAIAGIKWLERRI